MELAVFRLALGKYCLRRNPTTLASYRGDNFSILAYQQSRGGITDPISSMGLSCHSLNLFSLAAQPDFIGVIFGINRQGKIGLIAGYKISNAPEDMDITAIHAFISNTYWAKDIPFETLKRGIENSLCFGVFTDTRAQVGFARVVTDSATFAYLCDVYVLEEHRGKSLGKWLMDTLISHPELQGLRRTTLATVDAHKLYERYGFQALAKPENFMEIWKPKIYDK